MATATLSDRRNDISASFRLSASVRTEAAMDLQEGPPAASQQVPPAPNVVRGTKRPSPPATESRANVSKLGRRYRSLAAAQGLSRPCADPGQQARLMVKGWLPRGAR